MLLQLYRRVRKNALAELLSEVEDYGVAKKRWSSNVNTSLCMVSIIYNHIALYHESALLKTQVRKEFQSCFNTVYDLKEWLINVETLYKYFIANPQERQIPDELKGITNLQSKTVRLSIFMNVETSRSEISRVMFELKSLLLKILTFNNSSALPDVCREILTLRLANGYNTLLVFSELIAEVLLND